MDRGAWRATVHGVPKELDTTQRLNKTSQGSCLKAKERMPQSILSTANNDGGGGGAPKFFSRFYL